MWASLASYLVMAGEVNVSSYPLKLLANISGGTPRVILGICRPKKSTQVPVHRLGERGYLIEDFLSAHVQVVMS